MRDTNSKMKGIREQEILAIFMESVPDRIAFKDCEGRIMQANKAYAFRLGVSEPEQLIGKTEAAWRRFNRTITALSRKSL